MNNIYNAIQNLYNMDKTTWQEVIAELYNLVSNIENKFDLFELKFGSLLGEQIIKELKKMYANGSLASLINDVLLQDINDKVDTFKTEFSEQLDTMEIKVESNYVNVKYPPVGYLPCKGDGTTNDTQALQKLIDDFPNIYLPNGIYIVDSLTLKTYRHIIGQNSHDTVITPSARNISNFITIDKNPVQHLRIENITFNGKGNENPNQNGLYFKATGNVHGGLWNSIFKNIYVYNFNGVALSLISGGQSMFPIQVLTFERCSFRANQHLNTDSKAILVEGQVEQVLWLQCAFGGEQQTLGTGQVGVFRRRRNDDGSMVPGADTGGNGMTFQQCYIGNSLNGFNFERSSNIKLYGCYIERVKYPFNLNNVSNGIVIEGCEFRESGVDNGNGAIITGDLTGVSYIFKNSNLVTKPDKVIASAGNRVIENIWCNTKELLNLGTRIADTSISNGTVTVNTPGIRINSGNDLQNIYTNFHGDSEVTIVCNKSDGFNLIQGGNINIGKTISFAMFDIVTLKRFGSSWFITSIVRKTDYM